MGRHFGRRLAVAGFRGRLFSTAGKTGLEQMVATYGRGSGLHHHWQQQQQQQQNQQRPHHLQRQTQQRRWARPPAAAAGQSAQKPLARSVRPIPITIVTVAKGSSKGAELMAAEWADKLKR